MPEWVQQFQHHLIEQGYTASTLKILITLWAIGVILLVWFVVDNPWLLAAILAYEVLP